jgi:hypothetical protein
MVRPLALPSLVVSTAALCTPALAAQDPVVPVEEARLEDPSALAGQGLGWTVDLDGALAVVGGPGAATYSGLPGRALVYERSSASWNLVDELLPTGAQPSGYYAWSVAIQGERVVVGDSGAGTTGRAWVFERSGGSFVQTAELVPTASSGSVGAFGAAVDLDGDRVVVVAPYSGQVFEFRQQAGAWLQAAEIPLQAGHNRFLSRIALQGDRILVSMSYFVQILRRQAGGWTREAVLSPSEPTLAGTFGWSIALDGDLALVGDSTGKPYPHPGCGDGKVHVYERAGSSWPEVAVLTPPDVPPTDTCFTAGFGSSVALEGDTCVVGMPGGQVATPSLYVFGRTAAGWQRRARFTADDVVGLDGFGRWATGAALDGGRALVGAYERWTGGSGAAYVVRLTDGVGLAGCFGVGCPCANDDADAGCANSTGEGAALAGEGSNGVGADDLSLVASALPPFATGLVVAGDGVTRAPFADGLRCAAGALVRLPARQADGAGSFVEGPGVAGALALAPGDLRTFQAWYRDPAGPCTSGANLSSAYEVVFGP